MAPRNNLNPDLITRVHVLPVYLLVATAVVLLVMAYRNTRFRPLRRPLVIFAVVIGLQAVIGYWQHFTGLPILLVGLHMLGASLLAAACAHVVYVGVTRQPAGVRHQNAPAP